MLSPSGTHGEIDPEDSVEEFSSFDISDHGSIESNIQLEENNIYKSEDEHPFEDNNLSTPKKNVLLFSNKGVEHGSTSTKPSSRMSSDTFETPKTIETRASTMTSNSVFYPRLEPKGQLIFSAATRQPLKLNKSPMKRLSRCSDIDNTFDKELDGNKPTDISTMNDLFSEMALNDNVPSSNDVIELQNQVTDYKIQLKLMNNLIREKFMESGKNNQTLSDEFERQLSNSINASKYQMQLRALQKEHEDLKSSHKELESEFDQVFHANEVLNETNSENANNQHEWYNLVSNALKHLDITPSNESFNDNLHSLINSSNDFKTQREIMQKNITNLQDLNTKISNLTSKIDVYEQKSIEMERKIIDYEEKLSTEKNNSVDLMNENTRLISDLKYFRDREMKHDDVLRKLREVGNLNEVLVNENSSLKQKYAKESENMTSLTTMMSSYHSVVLKLLTKVIDPQSSGAIQDACSSLNTNSSIEQINKVFTVAHNFEIESLSTILKSYESLAKHKADSKMSLEIMNDLRSQIGTLNKKIHDLEQINDKETQRIQELEKQNNTLKKYSNNNSKDYGKLKNMRLEELNNKWKIAEEALVQTKKGAQMKIAELEEEIRLLKSQSR